MIKYYVRTTLERTLDVSYNQISYELLIDKEHNPVGSFIKQLEFLNDDGGVLLEDDLILCKDFKKRIENIIKKYPNRIINFFTFPNIFFETRDYQKFLWNQCTYYPKNITKKLASCMQELKKEITGKIQYDILESLALQKLNLKHIQYRPCLVQHLDGRSLIGNRESGRMSPYFIDYLEELRITYKQASLQNNRIKLKYLVLKTKKERGLK